MHIERGIIRRFDPAAWQADVELLGAHTALLAGVPVAGDLGAELLPAGSRVWVCLSDEGSLADAAVLAPYGAAPAPWVTSRLLKPTLALAAHDSLVTCNTSQFVNVTGLSAVLTLEVTSTVVLMLAATGYLLNNGISYTLAFYHDDAHETTQIFPVEAIGGAGAAANTVWDLSWLALQTGVAAGTHTFVLKHCISSGQAKLQRGLMMALAMG